MRGRFFGALAGVTLLATQLTACAPSGTVPVGTVPAGGPKAHQAGAAPQPPVAATALPSAGGENAAAIGTPPCPAAGVRVSASGEDAAAGTRTLELDLINCGSTPYTFGGYPSIQVLSADRRPFDVTVTHRPAFGESPDPGTIVAQPGKGAFVILEWHDIVTYGTSVTGTYFQIVPRPGDPPQLVMPKDPIDLGTTGTLQETPWAG